MARVVRPAGTSLDAADAARIEGDDRHVRGQARGELAPQRHPAAQRPAQDQRRAAVARRPVQRVRELGPAGQPARDSRRRSSSSASCMRACVRAEATARIGGGAHGDGRQIPQQADAERQRQVGQPRPGRDAPRQREREREALQARPARQAEPRAPAAALGEDRGAPVRALRRRSGTIGTPLAPARPARSRCASPNMITGRGAGSCGTRRGRRRDTRAPGRRRRARAARCARGARMAPSRCSTRPSGGHLPHGEVVRQRVERRFGAERAP